MSHRRSVDEKNRLKRLSEKTPHCYAGGAWYDEKKEDISEYGFPVEAEGQNICAKEQIRNFADAKTF